MKHTLELGHRFYFVSRRSWTQQSTGKKDSRTTILAVIIAACTAEEEEEEEAHYHQHKPILPAVSTTSGFRSRCKVLSPACPKHKSRFVCARVFAMTPSIRNSSCLFLLVCMFLFCEGVSAGATQKCVCPSVSLWVCCSPWLFCTPVYTA